MIDWKVDELKELDRKARKMMTLHGALHPKSDVDRLYLLRQKGVFIFLVAMLTSLDLNDTR